MENSAIILLLRIGAILPLIVSCVFYIKFTRKVSIKIVDTVMYCLYGFTLGLLLVVIPPQWGLFTVSLFSSFSRLIIRFKNDHILKHIALQTAQYEKEQMDLDEQNPERKGRFYSWEVESE